MRELIGAMRICVVCDFYNAGQSGGFTVNKTQF